MDMKEFVKPMLCYKSEPFDSDEWIFEKKFDGERVLVFVDKKNNYFRIQNRRLYDITKRLPEFSINHFSVDSCILDSELVLNSGKSKDYHDKHFKTRTNTQSVIRQKFLSKMYPLTLMVFDILMLDGIDLRSKPLIERKIILEQNIKENDRVKVVKYIEGKGKEFYEDLLKKGYEGMVAKRKDSIYEHKRSNYWLKVKPIKKMVVEVKGYKETSGWGSHGALITDFGDVALETERKEQEYFKRAEKGKVKIQVRYQELLPSGKFRFPKLDKFVD